MGEGEIKPRSVEEGVDIANHISEATFPKKAFPMGAGGRREG